MNILFAGQEMNFIAPQGNTLARLPIGHGEGVPSMPDVRSVVRRSMALANAAAHNSVRVDLLLTEALGSAYFHGPFRRSAKMIYESFLISQLLRIRRCKGSRLAVIDLGDDLTIHPINRRLLNACDVYFKRELAIDHWRSLESFHGHYLRVPSLGYRMFENQQKLVKKLAPISLGLGGNGKEALILCEQFGAPDIRSKLTDIFFAGEDWCRPLRHSIRDQLRNAVGGSVSISLPEGRVPFAEFAASIHASWLCVSPPGLGWDCYRHYEAGLMGAVPVLSRPDIQPHQPYRHGFDAIFYEPEQPILEQLTPWLDDKARLIEMSRRAHRRVLLHHTRMARSEYIIDRLLTDSHACNTSAAAGS